MSDVSNFGQDSVTDFKRSCPRKENKFQKNPLAAWSLLLYQTQDFLNNHQAQAQITRNQEGTIEMMHEVLSSLGAPFTDISMYEMSDLNNLEFYWEKDLLDKDAVFRPGIVTPF